MDSKKITKISTKESNKVKFHNEFDLNYKNNA